MAFFSKNPLLPNENEDQFKALEEDLIKTYQPRDAVEMHLVYRIYLTFIRQIRLREAEAVKLKISMMPEVLAESVTKILKPSTKREYTAGDLSNRTIESYNYFQAALKEIECTDFEIKEVSIETIMRRMPYVLSILKEKTKNKYTSSCHLIRALSLSKLI